jgi:hypothetical protein
MAELDVTGSKIRMISVLVEAQHQVPLRFNPVDAVVFIIDASGVPEPNLQTSGRRVVRITQEGCRIDICDDVPGPTSRRTVAHVLTPSLIRQSVVNVSEKSPLCIAVATSKKNHTVWES